MTHYIIKRLLWMIPTLLGIMVVNFIVIQAAPGGPIEHVMAQIKQGHGDEGSEMMGGSSGLQTAALSMQGKAELYRGREGLDNALVEQLRQQFGFNEPPAQRFWHMLKNYLSFDFGESFFKGERVIHLIKQKLPVSISLGLWSTLLIYLISIPLGIRKALKHGSSFDRNTSLLMTIGYAIPGFLFAMILIVFFAGGQFLSIFPLRGLVSDHWHDLSWPLRIADYFWHMALPITAMVIGGFASLSMLTKNSFLDEMSKAYVITAKAKGVPEQKILYHHVFRNALLIVIASFPSAFLSIFLTSSLLIEVIFSLDGLGLLGYEAAIGRDYPLIFATLYIFTLMGLIINLIGDILYTIIDPRIDFEARKL